MLAKRALDIVVSGALIVLTLPITVLIALMVKLDSAGPAVFTQTRVGVNSRRARALAEGRLNPAGERRRRDLGGAPFTMFKFRSMVQEAEAMLPALVNLGGLSEPVYKLDNDPRVTRFGRLLRQSSLDELPQLFNVLKGDMSLVGPRPEALRVVALYGENHRKRLLAKPGLTGLQQVTCRGTKSMAQRLEYDFHYIEHRSLWLDMVILFKTFFVVIRGNGAR
jgi:lipopolysaccharide/colanic/teichoic acid biosynthesis glycosyltransferase